jgi:hypothetical protein
MKNKSLAIFGIGTYILSIITSATDLEGNFRFPIAFIAISGIATIVFIIMATIRLWKGAKGVSITLAYSGVILIIFSVIQGVISAPDGSQLIILLNITKVFNLIAFIWAVVRLFKMSSAEMVSNSR